MRLFDVEDRAVASFDIDTAIVFQGGQWRRTTVAFARKALAEGYELSRPEFESSFPDAARCVPENLCQFEVFESLRNMSEPELERTIATVAKLMELEARHILEQRLRKYRENNPDR